MMGEKTLLPICQEMKWRKKQDTERCTISERNGVGWMKAEIWKLRGLRSGTDKGSCPFCLGKWDAKHTLMRCPGAKVWRIEFSGKIGLT
jgi:hypothetical protein